MKAAGVTASSAPFGSKATGCFTLNNKRGMVNRLSSLTAFYLQRKKYNYTLYYSRKSMKNQITRVSLCCGIAWH